MPIYSLVLSLSTSTSALYTTLSIRQLFWSGIQNNCEIRMLTEATSRSNFTKQLPTSVNMRISQLSSNQEAFSKTAPLYEAALRRSNYQADLKYSPNNSNKTRTLSRNIIWFNPPYSTNVRTNVGRNFLSLVDKHFPPSNPLHKIFNRNSVKVSYSCMNNCESVIQT
jgi:hypothetical protein